MLWRWRPFVALSRHIGTWVTVINVPNPDPLRSGLSPSFRSRWPTGTFAVFANTCSHEPWLSGTITHYFSSHMVGWCCWMAGWSITITRSRGSLPHSVDVSGRQRPTMELTESYVQRHSGKLWPTLTQIEGRCNSCNCSKFSKSFEFVFRKMNCF